MNMTENTSSSCFRKLIGSWLRANEALRMDNPAGDLGGMFHSGDACSSLWARMGACDGVCFKMKSCCRRSSRVAPGFRTSGAVFSMTDVAVSSSWFLSTELGVQMHPHVWKWRWAEEEQQVWPDDVSSLPAQTCWRIWLGFLTLHH